MACTRSANHNVVALALALMLCAPTMSPFSAYHAAPPPLRLPLHRASGRLGSATSRRSSSPLTVTMLNRAKKNARSSTNDDDDKTQVRHNSVALRAATVLPCCAAWGCQLGSFVSLARIDAWYAMVMLPVPHHIPFAHPLPIVLFPTRALRRGCQSCLL